VSVAEALIVAVPEVLGEGVAVVGVQTASEAGAEVELKEGAETGVGVLIVAAVEGGALADQESRGGM
jgi:hypothetical protein